MEKGKLEEIIVGNGITYRLAEDGCYFSQLSLEQKADYGEGGCDGAVEERKSDGMGAEGEWDKGESGGSDCK